MAIQAITSRLSKIINTGSKPKGNLNAQRQRIKLPDAKIVNMKTGRTVHTGKLSKVLANYKGTNTEGAKDQKSAAKTLLGKMSAVKKKFKQYIPTAVNYGDKGTAKQKALAKYIFQAQLMQKRVEDGSLRPDAALKKYDEKILKPFQDAVYGQKESEKPKAQETLAKTKRLMNFKDYRGILTMAHKDNPQYCENITKEAAVQRGVFKANTKAHNDLLNTTGKISIIKKAAPKAKKPSLAQTLKRKSELNQENAGTKLQSTAEQVAMNKRQAIPMQSRRKRA